MDQDTQIICNFLSDINLPHALCPVEGKMFLPGLQIVHGVLHIDIEQLVCPGDILHEAGHIAVCEPIFRPQLHEDVYKNGLKNGREKQAMEGEEMAATAWSVAAIWHLGLPIDLVFPENSYQGMNQALKENFEKGGIFGDPLLTAWDMTCPDKGFPTMTSWIREVRWLNELPEPLAQA
ncbi:hypothetical protein CWC22_003870 [Pseudoalteromonas rubra]|uniref:Uncharacterized protein n=1 Tax=Pseudoalteromonas rubra TaxID=43658 RepID=A0A5S3V4W2_9GAMM|nr:hypothetical protein [Pseudoalteromonas rubra]QPB82193.1 hypothetical protein CWC22_003870 [Pseudoalteromonas rubra]